jgi:hypothetical protein
MKYTKRHVVTTSISMVKFRVLPLRGHTSGTVMEEWQQAFQEKPQLIL